MNYLTQYYKTLSEDLQRKVTILENKIMLAEDMGMEGGDDDVVAAAAPPRQQPGKMPPLGGNPTQPAPAPTYPPPPRFPNPQRYPYRPGKGEGYGLADPRYEEDYQRWLDWWESLTNQQREQYIRDHGKPKTPVPPRPSYDRTPKPRPGGGQIPG